LLYTTSYFLEARFVDLFFQSIVFYLAVQPLAVFVMLASIRFLESVCKNRGQMIQHSLVFCFYVVLATILNHLSISPSFLFFSFYLYVVLATILNHLSISPSLLFFSFYLYVVLATILNHLSISSLSFLFFLSLCCPGYHFKPFIYFLPFFSFLFIFMLSWLPFSTIYLFHPPFFSFLFIFMLSWLPFSTIYLFPPLHFFSFLFIFMLSWLQF